MMTNLFSMFDPSTYHMNMAWVMIPMSMTALFMSEMKNNKLQILMKMMMNNLKKEIKSMMPNKTPFSMKMMVVIFTNLTMINLLSLLPFNFTITSQINVNIPMSLTMWMSFLILGWSKNTKHMLSHLLPMGTPNMLMPIMIMIELISQIIRPITLSVRLTANMLAGHLLLSLLGNMSISSKNMFMLNLPVSMMLTFLEICVSIIQAYVFMTLITLYSTEIN
uniref:ATP synthase subunit a n=1 Tax=Unionicola parkeri TaxID=350891 RepID=E3W3L7_9ACAR|nr:ATP synthase F0 subunit 6 [Unionicola parkeri]ADP01827.1 ATP synthase subunit 6 [Unionicola parkeri]